MGIGAIVKLVIIKEAKKRQTENKKIKFFSEICFNHDPRLPTHRKAFEVITLS